MIATRGQCDTREYEYLKIKTAVRQTYRMSKKILKFASVNAPVHRCMLARGVSDVMYQNIGLQSVRCLVVCEDGLFYNAFPSVVKTPNAELLVAFRRAPNRQAYGQSGNRHVDHNSYLVFVRFTDRGHWTAAPELIYAHPFGDSQDRCVSQLTGGTIISTGYGWTAINPGDNARSARPYFQSGGYPFLGGYVARSNNGAKSWQGPSCPPSVRDEHQDLFGKPIATYNGGALYETEAGRILRIVAAHDKTRITSNYLMTSDDKRLTRNCTGIVPQDDNISFNEASGIQRLPGDIVGLRRTVGYRDQAVISRSTDGRKTCRGESMGFQGHPLNDGGNPDIGYTWSVQLDDNRVLNVCYFNTTGH